MRSAVLLAAGAALPAPGHARWAQIHELSGEVLLDFAGRANPFSS